MLTSSITAIMLAVILIITSITTFPEASAQEQGGPLSCIFGGCKQQDDGDNEDNIVTIVSHSLTGSLLGWANVVGEVRNDSPDETLMAVFINAKFYDSSGQLIHLARGDVHNLRPGEKGPFRILVADPSISRDIANYTLSTELGTVSMRDTPAALKIGITKQGLRERGVGSEPLYQIIGNVTNMGNLTATSIIVTATFYDATGRMVDFDFTDTVPSGIPPGQSADFIIETLPSVETLMGDYGNRTSTWTIASANLTAHSLEYLSMMAPP